LERENKKRPALCGVMIFAAREMVGTDATGDVTRTERGVNAIN